MTTRRSLKRQAMPKPSLKTRKRLKQVRKLNLRRISTKRRRQNLKDYQKHKEKAPSLKVTRSKDHLKAPIEHKVSSKGNLEKERGQITCLRKTCQIIAKRWSK
ncbi:Hypothetical_protein [Hexamita inflata]|uniref:Hypothetical_protein n=1 Tax=Hexamita inflata TaxID=28002 RepID=A0AA86UN66_9EUKA|nr:Hypothetical protein HINF_LOCUS45707 [Hexamita inflata]